MFPAPFDYVAPARAADAIDLLCSVGEDAKVLAGGQSLIPLMKLRLAAPTCLVDLGRIRELAGIGLDDGGWLLGGAMVTGPGPGGRGRGPGGGRRGHRRGRRAQPLPGLGPASPAGRAGQPDMRVDQQSKG
jgi:FAD binding domain in molybdopterin dehydrogenase